MCLVLFSLWPLMKTNADDSLFPLPLLLLPHHFTLFLHLNAIFWNSRTLFSFAIPFAPPPPFSHISPFLSFSLFHKRNELQLFWIYTCVCIDLHTDIPLFHWFCLHAFQLQLHRQSFNNITQCSSSSSPLPEHLPIPNAINRMFYQNARTHTLIKREKDENITAQHIVMKRILKEMPIMHPMPNMMNEAKKRKESRERKKIWNKMWNTNKREANEKQQCICVHFFRTLMRIWNVHTTFCHASQFCSSATDANRMNALRTKSFCMMEYEELQQQLKTTAFHQNRAEERQKWHVTCSYIFYSSTV